MKMNKILLAFCFMLSGISGVTAQDIITLNTANTAGGTVQACEGIVLKPGFSFTATSVKSLRLTVNELVCEPYRIETINASSNKNYIVTITPLDASDQASFRDGKLTIGRNARALVNIDYYDGLGRPEQSVQVGITPNKKDLVTLQEYDGFGRESNMWLPGYGSGQGAYTAPATVKTSAKTSALNNDQNPYSHPVYENSPLNRVQQQFGAGSLWHDNEKAVEYQRHTNSTSADYICAYYYLMGDHLKKEGNYANNQLFAEKTFDEDGNWSVTLTDKLGRTILHRAFNNMPYDTYYVYDDFGNLRYVLPPIASSMLQGNKVHLISSDAIIKYAYVYKYDHRNRCIEKKLPGADWMYYVYDKADRLILSQDGEQRQNSQWAFNKYDAFGRVLISGVYSESKTRAQLEEEFKETVVAETKGGNYGYTWNYMPRAAYTNTLLVNHYDDYEHLLNQETKFRNNLDYAAKSGYGKRYENGTASAKGLLVGTRVSLLDRSAEIVTAYYYDDMGRVVQKKATNYSGGFDREYYAYDFAGNVTQKLHEHTTSTNASVVSELYTYAYDHAGRLTETRHKLNSGNEVVLAKNEYDELGRLKESKSAGQNNLKNTYSYNVRSWMRGVTNPLFSQTLTYNEGSNPLYNGNIRCSDWTYNGANRTYNYTYDKLSRLKKAEFTSDHVNDRYSEYNTEYNYDLQGNILSLKRNKYWTTTVMDNLSMSYNGNQLTKVTESGDVLEGYTGANTALEAEYFYDKNGSLKEDKKKGATYAYYSYNNMPQYVSVNHTYTKGLTTYKYTADGQKLMQRHFHDPRNVVQPASGTVFTESDFSGSGMEKKEIRYEGNLIYINGALDKILTANGYIKGGKYYFYLRDHLGNNRAVADQTGTVVQRTDYYPFGLPFPYAEGEDVQPYKFGGKEYDTMHGLNLLDFHARAHNPELGGRFNRIDPLAEKYYSISPYVYCGNNPVNAIDLRGDSISFTIDNNIVTMHVTGKVINVSGNENIDMDKAREKISSQIESSFQGKMTDGMLFRTQVNLSVANDMGGVNDSDHVFALADIGSVNGYTANGAVNEIGGKVAFISADYFSGPWDTSIGNLGQVTAAHEFGHLASLKHGKGLMVDKFDNPFYIAGNRLNDEQLTEIYKSRAFLNKGSNWAPALKKIDGRLQYVKMPNRGNNITSRIVNF